MPRNNYNFNQIKMVFISLILGLSILSTTAQETNSSRKDRRANRKEKRMEEVKQWITERSFLFEATHAQPSGGGSLSLTHTYGVELKGDTLISYLPFFGVAYQVDFGNRNSPMDFTQPIQRIETEESKDGYLIKLEVKNNMDNLSYTWHISSQGFATLHVTSTSRRAISYTGQIDTYKEEFQP
ncbi:MAG: DUF4251 domain-containing protein [Mariniphaga sp.]|nr:DUF4251 domain-containing protein [Mariniphaga sp.]